MKLLAISAPQLSICIATLDRASDLKTCFDALQLTRGLDSVEILVVNNGAGEDTERICQLYQDLLPVRYIRHPQPTLAEVLNRAWREAEAEWVAYIDDDSIVYPGWLEAILPALSRVDSRCFAMGGNVDMGNEPPVLPDWCHPDFAQSAFSNVQFGPEDKYLEFPACPIGNNLAFRRAFIQRHGGFPGELRTYWENYLVWQGYWQGGSCFFNSEMRVAHIPGPRRFNRKWALNKAWVMGQNYQRTLSLLQKYPQCPPRYDFLKTLPLALVKLAVSFLIRSRRHQTAFQALVLFDLARIREIFDKRSAPEYSTFQTS
jgi:glycosyltransferase involved in cell wall biosynthesis